MDPASLLLLWIAVSVSGFVSTAMVYVSWQACDGINAESGHPLPDCTSVSGERLVGAADNFQSPA